MSKYLFTSFAANYPTSQIFRHLFATGTSKHSTALVEELADHYDAQQVHLYSTGRSALAAAIRATIPTGSLVAIAGLTCRAVPQAVRSARCTPVYIDISATTYNYEARDLLRTLATHQGIKAIIIQNMLGSTGDIVALEKIAKKRNIIIIEDLAHCAGTHYRDGREVGTVGSATALSFGKGKSLDTVRGGATIIRTTTPVKKLSAPTQLAPLSHRLRDRFYPLLGLIARALYHVKLGKPFTALIFKAKLVTRSADGDVSLRTRLTHWQAKLALRQFQNLQTTVKARTRTSAQLITHLQLPPIPAGSALLRLPLLVPDRKNLLARFRQNHIYFDDIWYDVPVSPARTYAKEDFPEADCPTAVAVASLLANLPTYYSLDKLAPALKIIKEQTQ